MPNNGQTPLVLCAVDKPGWAFDHIAQQLQRLLSQYYRFKIVPYNRITKETCDILLNFWWATALRVKANVKAGSVITCVYDGLSWKIDEGSQKQFRLVLRNTDLLAVCNEPFAKELQGLYGADTPPIFLTEDGVDTEIFRPGPRFPSKVCIGWTGDSTRHTPGAASDLKGLGVIKEAQARAGVALRILDASQGGVWPINRMPEFYESISAYVCASYIEGTPNPILEAMACGRPVITTDVGIVSKIVKDGHNGFIVDRHPDAIAAAIKKIKDGGPQYLAMLGANARSSAGAFSWTNKIRAWKSCFDTAMVYTKKSTNPPMALSKDSSFRPRPVVGAGQLPVKEIKAVPIDPPVHIKADIARAMDIKIGTLPLQDHEKKVAELAHVVASDIQHVVPDVRAERRRMLLGGAKPKALLISDVPNWAFHVNLMDLEEYLKDQFDFEHWHVIDHINRGYTPDIEEQDILFCVYHRWPIDGVLPYTRTVGSLRAFWFFPEDQKPPGQKEYDLVNQYRAFHVVTQRNYDELKDHCRNVVYLTNPVNMKRFPTPTPVDGEVIASWNGNAKHRSGPVGDVKGFSSLVQPACRAAGIRLESVEYNTTRVAPSQMHEFYRRANLALCASMYEGASNSVMEAMACGQALITTNCGNIEEIQQSQLKYFNDTGIVIVERTTDGLINAMNKLKKNPRRVAEMGKINRKEIAARWSWDFWKDRYAEFLKKAL